MSTVSVIEALLAPKEYVKPEQWIALLKAELQSPALKQTPLAQVVKSIKGKKFSEIAKVFSVRFGVEINSPSELIVALWLYLDRYKGITVNDTAPSFKEMLGGQTLQQAIIKAKMLMEGFPVCR